MRATQRGTVEAYSCKPKEARADIEEAIELAKRSGEEEAAEEYARIIRTTVGGAKRDNGHAPNLL